MSGQASNQSDAVFMVAPGVGIAASNGTVTGTSASAAMVAGAAAVMQANDSSASPSVIVGRLARNAEAVEGVSGNGRLHLGRALIDESTSGVTPAGAPGGGPVIGPYAAAARNLILTFAGTGTGSVKITPSTGTVLAPIACGGTGRGRGFANRHQYVFAKYHDFRQWRHRDISCYRGRTFDVRRLEWSGRPRAVRHAQALQTHARRSWEAARI